MHLDSPRRTSGVFACLLLGLAGLMSGCGSSSGSSGGGGSDSAPDLQLVGSLFAATGLEGGPFLPRGQNFTVVNTGTTPLDWSIEFDEDWASVAPALGVLAPGANATVTLAIVDTVAADLEEGKHAGDLVIRDDTSGKVLRWQGAATIDIDYSGPRSSVEQFGTTWHFDGDYTVGRFTNRDWWVVGPVGVTRITPDSEAGARTVNGAMLNPSPTLDSQQGYDSAMYGDAAVGQYDPELNVAAGLASGSPLLLEPHSSLVSSVSLAQPGALPQLRSAAVLTVLDAAPSRGSFRPPYSGDDKTIRFHENQLDFDLLGTLPPVASTPPIEVLEAAFERPWIDHIPRWLGGYGHPEENMPRYGRDMAARIGEAALFLHLDFPAEHKRKLLVRFVQLGIDLFGIVEAGGLDNWSPDGGHASGRKWPILFAGLLLNDPQMSAIGFEDDLFFGEDAQTFYVEETSPGVYNDGHGGYTANEVGLPEWGMRHATVPELDDVEWDLTYRICCTANAWNGMILAAYVMGARNAWNHEALFDYMDRYVETTRALGYEDHEVSWSDFTIDMWDAYRSSY